MVLPSLYHCQENHYYEMREKSSTLPPEVASRTKIYSNTSEPLAVSRHARDTVFPLNPRYTPNNFNDPHHTRLDSWYMSLSIIKVYITTITSRTVQSGTLQFPQEVKKKTMEL